LIGNETYDIFIKDLRSGAEVDLIRDTGGGIVWGNDDSTIYYAKLDEELRQYQIWLHTIGTGLSFPK
jgi:oligopeptidase B